MRFKLKRRRFMALQLPDRKNWAVMDRHTGELVERAKDTEKLPEPWARNRADRLNKDHEKKLLNQGE